MNFSQIRPHLVLVAISGSTQMITKKRLQKGTSVCPGRSVSPSRTGQQGSWSQPKALAPQSPIPYSLSFHFPAKLCIDPLLKYIPSVLSVAPLNLTTNPLLSEGWLLPECLGELRSHVSTQQIALVGSPMCVFSSTHPKPSCPTKPALPSGSSISGKDTTIPPAAQARSQGAS